LPFKPVATIRRLTMTARSDEVRTSGKVIVFFDICSSSKLVENLLITNNQRLWRNLLIGLKEFLHREEVKLGFEIYKFLGDGWILLFPEGSIRGEKFLRFCRRLCVEYERLFFAGVYRVLSTSDYILGLTFGVESGMLIEMEMTERQESFGQSMNVAARLQGAVKEGDRHPQGKMLISRNAFAKMGLFENARYAGELVTLTLRNINNGADYIARKIVVHRGESPLTRLKRNRIVRRPRSPRPILKILSATYGRDEKQFDVTEKLRTMTKNNVLEVTSDNHLGGDPLPFKVKVLRIVYSVNGEERTKLVPEHDNVRLPP
jgi:class 3 adenylate cyclase